MAVIILRQTDTEAGCADSVGCSGGTLAGTPQGKQATEGGTAGVTEVQAICGKDVTEVCVLFNSAAGEPGNTSWAAGTYVMRLNITTGGFIGSWQDCYVCRFNSACANQATVASLTGQAIDIESAGVYTMTITGGALQTAAASDLLYFVLIFQNQSAGGLNIDFTPDQLIDTPIEQPAAGGPVEVPLIMAPYQPA